MKKLISAVCGASAIVAILAGVAKSEDRTYGNYLLNNKAISYSTAPVLKLDTIDDLSMVAVYSSATVPTVTFTSTTVNTTSSIIGITAHGLVTGNPMLLTGSGVPTGLSAGTTYYVIATDANDIQLALTSTGSIAGTFVPLTAVGTSTSTLTPTPFSGTWTISWQGSNDNVLSGNLVINWFTLTNATGVTYSTPGATEWDGPIYCRWIRPVFTAGTGGAMNIQIIGNGKRKS